MYTTINLYLHELRLWKKKINSQKSNNDYLLIKTAYFAVDSFLSRVSISRKMWSTP